MKKNIIIGIAILFGLYFVLKVLNMNSEFFPEKLYFQALKAEEKIAVNPEEASRKFYDRVELKLRRILQLFPNSPVADKANMRLAEFYIKYKKYGSAIAHLDQVIEKYEKYRERLALSYFLRGIAYEKQDMWAEALRQYGVVRDNYGNTQVGLEVPLHIWNYYAVNGSSAEAKEAYDYTIQYYKKLESENSGKPLAYMASLFLIRTYAKANDAEATVAAIKEHIDKYYSPATMDRIIPLIETIVANRFKNPEKAVEIYKFILERSKTPKLNSVLEKRIKELSVQTTTPAAP